ASLILPVPVVESLQPPDHAETPKRDLVRARVVAHVGGLAGSVGEELEPVVAGAELVRNPGAGRAGNDAAGLDRVLLVAQHDRSLAVQHYEELLLERMAVQRGRLLSRGDRVVLHPGGPRTNRHAEVP